MKYTFSAFGLSVEHPEDYRIWFNPNRPFYKDEGEFRLDKMTKVRDEEISMTIGWWSEQERIHDFAGKFLSEVEKQFEKASKKGGYKAFKKEIVEFRGHDAAFVYSGAIGSSHAFKSIGKKVQLQTLQMAWFCEESKRTIIASIFAPASYVKEHYPELKEMLYSIKCHETAESGDMDKQRGYETHTNKEEV